jgi:hypothetical protein
MKGFQSALVLVVFILVVFIGETPAEISTKTIERRDDYLTWNHHMDDYVESIDPVWHALGESFDVSTLGMIAPFVTIRLSAVETLDWAASITIDPRSDYLPESVSFPVCDDSRCYVRYVAFGTSGFDECYQRGCDNDALADLLRGEQPTDRVGAWVVCPAGSGSYAITRGPDVRVIALDPIARWVLKQDEGDSKFNRIPLADAVSRIKSYIRTTYRYLPNGSFFLEPDSAKAVIQDRAHAVIEATITGDPNSLAEFIHPHKGIRISQSLYVLPEDDIIITRNDIPTLENDDRLCECVSTTGSGRLRRSPRKNILSFSSRYAEADDVTYNRLRGEGNMISTIHECYPNSIEVRYHVPGRENEHGWSSLFMIYEQYEGEWYLVGSCLGYWTM